MHAWLRATIGPAVSHSRPYGPQPMRLLCAWRFSRRESWSGLPCPPPGDLPDPGIKPASCMSCISRQILYHSLPLAPPGKSTYISKLYYIWNSYTV